MVDVLALAVRFGLAVVFAVAAAAKLRDREGTADALRSFGVPDALVPQAIYLLPAAEALAASLLLIPATYVLGAGLSFLLLGAFTLAIIVNLARGNRPACRCFGEMSAKPIGLRTVARNVALASLAIYVLVTAPSSWSDARQWLASLTPEDAKLSIGYGLLALATAAQTWLVLRLRDQNQALAVRLQALETAGQPVGLEPGTDAPLFELPTVEGPTQSLRQLLARGKPVVLVFTDPHCGPCQSLVPQLAMWQKSLANVFTVGIISRGTIEQNATHAQKNEIAEVMVQEQDEVAEAFRSAGTPSALKISPEGTVDSAMAVGVEQITELFESTISEHARGLWQQATGEEIPRPFTGLPMGSEAPELVVHDLDGAQHRLPDLLEEPTMLLFWSPRCGFCHEIVDQVRLLEGRLPEGRQLLITTVGTPQENEVMGLRSRMLYDPDFEIGAFFLAQGTPAAVLIEGGTVASRLESGTEGVLSLGREFAGPEPQRLAAPEFHTSAN